MSKERTLKMYDGTVKLLTKIVEEAYFKSEDAREKKLLAKLLERLN